MSEIDLEAPEYCCAILRDAAARYLIERRPAHSIYHARRLTCFGGAREAGESPERCIARELAEELGWDEQRIAALRLRRAVRLEAPSRLIAWFFVGEAVDPAWPVRCEPGYEVAWMTETALLNQPSLSSWHRAAVCAMIAGEGTARVAK